MQATIRRQCLCLAALILFAVPLPAQPRARDPIAEAIKALRWRSIGPVNNAGRIAAVAGVPGDPSTYYVGAAAGGIIKTTNAGVTFTHIFDKQDNASIGAIAIAPSDPNVIYVGTGEGNPRNSASVGDGMYKSIDAGDSWKKIGLDKTDKIARLIIDAKNPDIVYACALGREWGENEDRGVYKTTDGGKNWRKILYVDAATGCSDISSDVNNSNIVYAGMYTYRRWAWFFTSGGRGTAVYKTVDGGETWDRLSGADRERGLPKTAMDRIGIAAAPSDPNIVYVLSETKTEGELWRSDDAGRSWRTVNRDPNINFRPFYYSDIRVDTKDPNRVYALAGGLSLSEDGGTTFRGIAQSVHGDLRHFRDSVLARPLPGLGYRQYPRLREEAQSVAGMIARPTLGGPTAGELLRSGEIRSENDGAQTRLDGIVQTRVLKINQLLAGSPHLIAPPARIVP